MTFWLRSMTLVAAITILIQTGAASQQAPGTTPMPPADTTGMTNADVIKLVKTGLSEQFIVDRIRQETAPRFDVSVDALVALKAAGVSEAILQVMLNLPPATTAPGSIADVPAPSHGLAGAADREPGIYIDTEPEGGSLVFLEPTVFTQGRTGGVLASAFTYGIYKAKWKAIIRSPRANIRTRLQRPTFYFHFEQKGAPFGSGAFAGWLSAATSPNEFVLAQMVRKRDERELIVGEFGAFSSRTGTRSEDTVPLRIERLAPGAYRVTPDEDLGPGEFCFFYAAGAATLGAGVAGKLFDFGVDRVEGAGPR